MGTLWVEMVAMTVMWVEVEREVWDLMGALGGPTRRVLQAEERANPTSSML